jgi:hypothetical protein
MYDMSHQEPVIAGIRPTRARSGGLALSGGVGSAPGTPPVYRFFERSLNQFLIPSISFQEKPGAYRTTRIGRVRARRCRLPSWMDLPPQTTMIRLYSSMHSWPRRAWRIRVLRPPQCRREPATGRAGTEPRWSGCSTAGRGQARDGRLAGCIRLREPAGLDTTRRLQETLREIKELGVPIHS